jgi:hypothetical protein
MEMDGSFHGILPVEKGTPPPLRSSVPKLLKN